MKEADANGEGDFPTNLLLTFLDNTISGWRSKGRDASILQMNRATFNLLAASNDFSENFVVKFGSYEHTGMITPEMGNALLEAVAMPFRIKVINEYIEGKVLFLTGLSRPSPTPS